MQRIIEDSSSESEGEVETELPSKSLPKVTFCFKPYIRLSLILLFVSQKQKIQSNGVPKLKKKFLTPDKIKRLKKKRPEDKRKAFAVKALLKEKRVNLDMTTATENKSGKVTSIIIREKPINLFN